MAVLVGGEEGGRLTGGMNRTMGAMAISPFIRQRFAMFITGERGDDLERLATLIGAGDLTPTVERSYPLAQAPAAIRDLAAGRVRGKVAITI
jgi:NADPH:quinone reductase-like Zn-dependent oxidoreductase